MEELEVVRKLQHCGVEEYRIALEKVEKILLEYEQVKNANSSEALKGLKTSLHNEWLRFYPQLEQLDETTKIVDGCRMIKSDADNYLTIKNYILKAQKQEALLKTGDLSDGYHTFNQLYYQRCILFASLVRLNKDKSWKSFKHSDGKYCFDSNGEWFIVGIDTPIGSYTYHYEKKYWDLFECQELECGKEWDGHTEEDVTRLLSLPNEQEKEIAYIEKIKTMMKQKDCVLRYIESEDCFVVKTILSECWYKLTSEFVENNVREEIKPLPLIEKNKQLKEENTEYKRVLEIIFKKRVDMWHLVDLLDQTYEMYLAFCESEGYDNEYILTQGEFDLLKRWHNGL